MDSFALSSVLLICLFSSGCAFSEVDVVPEGGHPRKTIIGFLPEHLPAHFDASAGYFDLIVYWMLDGEKYSGRLHKDSGGKLYAFDDKTRKRFFFAEGCDPVQLFKRVGEACDHSATADRACTEQRRELSPQLEPR
jgi:hypothetical protein